MASIQTSAQRYPARIRKGEITREGPWTIVQSRRCAAAMKPGDLVFVNATERYDIAGTAAEAVTGVGIVTYEQTGKVSSGKVYASGDFVPAVIFGFVGAEAGGAHNIGTKLVFNTTDEDFDALAVADNTYGAAEAAQLNSKHKILAMSESSAAGDIIEVFIQPN